MAKPTGPLQDLMGLVLGRLRAQLRTRYPSYLDDLEALSASQVLTPSELGDRLAQIEADHGVDPSRSWEALAAHLYDYDMKFDTVRYLNELIQASEGGRELFHLTSLLSVALFACAQSLDELVTMSLRAQMISIECADAVRKRVSLLTTDPALNRARHQVHRS